MADSEKLGFRCASYSQWHRKHSISRFVGGVEVAERLPQIDLDGVVWVEYRPGEFTPVFLVETAVDVGQQSKNCAVTARLGAMASIPAYSVFYKLSNREIPGAPGYKDIEQFRIRRLFPTDFQRGEIILSPEQWAKNIANLRNGALMRNINLEAAKVACLRLIGEEIHEFDAFWLDLKSQKVA